MKFQLEDTMTFACPNIDEKTGDCRMLKTICVPGRKGCVLDGKVKFSEPVEERIKRAEELRQNPRRRRR